MKDKYKALGDSIIGVGTHMNVVQGNDVLQNKSYVRTAEYVMNNRLEVLEKEVSRLSKIFDLLDLKVDDTA